MESDLVTVATSFNVVEAEFLRNHLIAEGFEVFLFDENIIGANNLLAGAIGGIKIKVPSDCAQQAVAAVRDLRSAVADEPSGFDTGLGSCARCGSRDLSARRASRNEPGRSRWLCNSCGLEWEEG